MAEYRSERYERSVQFDTLMRLRELAEPNRFVPADDWAPDMSGLDGVTTITDAEAGRAIVNTWWERWRNER